MSMRDGYKILNPEGVPGESANGSIFIYNLIPDAGNINITLIENNTRVGSAAASPEVTQVTVQVFAYTGHTNVRPNATVNGQAVNWSTNANRNPTSYFGSITLPIVSSYVVLHEDNVSHTVQVSSDAKPVISLAEFTGGYPGSQTELKDGDNYDIHVVANIPFVNIQVDNQQAFDSVQTNNVSSGIDRTSTFIIGDRGIVTHTYPARVRVQKSTGTWSDWVWTNVSGNIDEGIDGSEVVNLNNLYPSVESMNQSSISYPGIQEAIKQSESATIHSTCSNFDIISYISSTGELLINNNSTYEENKQVSRQFGNYNITNINYEITATRTANNAIASENVIVFITHVAAIVSIIEATSYLRSGGNNGTSPQDHIITLTSNQNLLSTPTIAAIPIGQGSWVNSFSGGPLIWVRTLRVDDSDLKGSYAYGVLSAVNLANIETIVYTGDSNYILRGFVSRDITLAAFANEANMDVEAVTYANVVMTWNVKALPNKRPVGTTAVPDPDSWCLHTLNTNPTIIRILDTAATSSSSQASTITIEETL